MTVNKAVGSMAINVAVGSLLATKMIQEPENITGRAD
jgi:hypothetical protein